MRIDNQQAFAHPSDHHQHLTGIPGSPGRALTHHTTAPRPAQVSTQSGASETGALNKYRSHAKQVPFSRQTSTVLATNKYRSREQ